MQHGRNGDIRAMSAFEIYLRTGRLPRGDGIASDVEVKFNPWHDPDNGRFTFVGQGRYFGRGGQTPTDRGAPSLRTDWPRRNLPAWTPGFQHDPKNPHNYSVHVVRGGDTLSSIAKRRKGVSVADLTWLNGISADRPLKIGQPIKLPNQDFLDAGREARNRSLALAYYMEKNGGKLPPNPAKPPSIEEQRANERHTIFRNGYTFQVDALPRTREIKGEVTLAKQPRSRRNQALAGGADRRPGDDGGHFASVRLNGPLEWFNHFAQDSNFNRGAYRVLEDSIVREKRAGNRVYIHIVPHYPGYSQRPDNFDFTWYVNGQRHYRHFNNRKGGR